MRDTFAVAILKLRIKFQLKLAHVLTRDPRRLFVIDTRMSWKER